jgi:hypothetical protein
VGPCADSTVAVPIHDGGGTVVDGGWDPLFHCRSTDCAQNVLAAKACTIRWKGVDCRVTHPKLVGIDVALRAAGRFERTVIRWFDFPGFLRLQR